MVEMSKSKMFLGGEWVAPSTGDYFESHNPYTGKPWLMVGRGGEEDANRAVEAAKKMQTERLKRQRRRSTTPNGGTLHQRHAVTYFANWAI